MLISRKRLDLEELYFTFWFKMAKPHDFQKYLRKKETCFVDSYFRKITLFFQEHYSKDYREYVCSVLSKEHSDLLQKFDSLFLITFDDKKVLKYINKEIISSKEIEIQTKNHLQNLISSYLQNINQCPSPSIDLFFYLTIIHVIILNDEFSVDVVKRIIEQEFGNNSHYVFKNFTEIALALKTKKQLFDNFRAFSDNIFKEEKENIKIVYIRILFLIELKTILIEDVFKLLCEMSLVNFYIETAYSMLIQICLDFFTLLLKNRPKKENIQTIVFHMKTLTCKSSTKILLIKWLFSNIKKYNLSYDSFEDHNEFLKLLINEKEYSLLNEIVLYFSKFPISLYNCYSKLKSLAPLIKKQENSISEIEKLKYSMRYFRLITNKYKIENKFKIVSKIKIHSINESVLNPFISIHCVFVYLHSGLKSILENDNIFSKVFKDIEQNKNVDFIENNACCKKQIESFKNGTKKLFESFINNVELIYIADKINNLKHHSTQSNIFKFFQSIPKKKSIPIILYLKLPPNNPEFFTDKFISHHSKIQIEKSVVNQNYQYLLKGFYILHEGGEQNVLLYNKYTLSWYSVKHKIWTHNINIDMKLDEIYIVYFLKEQKKVDNLLTIQKESQFKFPNEQEKELYYSTLSNLYYINPKLFRINNDWLIKAFNLTSIQNLQYFYEQVKKSNSFKTNNEGKTLLIFLTSKLKIIKNKRIENIKNEIFNINLLVQKIDKFFQQNNSNELITNDICLELEFCFDNILIFQNIPEKIIFLLTLLYSFSKSAQKEGGIYCSWLDFCYENNIFQNQFIVLLSKIKFNSKDLGNFETYFDQRPINNTEIDNCYRFLTQIIIFFNKYEQNSDIAEQYLLKIFNQHTYLFYNCNETTNQNNLIQKGLQLFYKSLCQFQFNNESDKSRLFKLIFHFELENFQKRNIPCFSSIKELIIDDYINILLTSGNHDNSYPNELINKSIRIYLLKSKQSTKNELMPILIENWIDNYNITKEQYKIESIKKDCNISFFPINYFDICLPFILIHKELKLKKMKL